MSTQGIVGRKPGDLAAYDHFWHGVRNCPYPGGTYEAYEYEQIFQEEQRREKEQREALGEKDG